MATNPIKVVNTDREKVKQVNPRNVSSPIRIKSETKSLLDDLLTRANKNHVGRKIKPNDVICYALKLLSSDNLVEISQAALSNKDRLEMLFRREQKKNKSLNRDSFYGLLLQGSILIDEQK